MGSPHFKLVLKSCPGSRGLKSPSQFTNRRQVVPQLRLPRLLVRVLLICHLSPCVVPSSPEPADKRAVEITQKQQETIRQRSASDKFDSEAGDDFVQI